MNPADYLIRTLDRLTAIDPDQITLMVGHLQRLRDRHGRLFIIGNGGGQAHASHAAADFRKIGHIESYAWGDNTADLTAWVNDTSWDESTTEWLKASNYTRNDGLLVFSVGGTGPDVSANLWSAVQYCTGSLILGITGRPGELANYATTQIVLDADTAQTESLQSVLWHCLVQCM